MISDSTTTITINELETFFRLIGKELKKDEFYFFIKKCINPSDAQNFGRAHLNQSQDSLMSDDLDKEEEDPLLNMQQSSENDLQLNLDFFKIMDALEQFAEENTWNPLIICSSVLSAILRSGNPISIFELKRFIRGFKVITEDELEILLAEMKYLQSVKANIGVDEVSMIMRDLIISFPK